MKYKVSLLPEINRKRLINKRKLEKIKSYALIVMLIMFALLMVVLLARMYAVDKLEAANDLNNEYAQKVQQLEQYRQINANLQEKIQLITDIQVDEPQLVNFVANLGNLEIAGISIDSINCTDWKTLRTCSLSGSAISREQYLAFTKALEEMEGVSSVTPTGYTSGAVAADGRATFSLAITCSGGSAVATTQAETVAEETTEE